MIDANAINAKDFPRRNFPAFQVARSGRFRIAVEKSALEEMKEHALSAGDIEICGVMAGGLYGDSNGPFLYIEKAIKGEAAKSSNANVTFTAETWSRIHGELEKMPGCPAIVGWYHSHPGFGVFLSNMDIFIHENFFSAPWQTAYVFDPLSMDDGWFVWKNGKVKRDDSIIAVCGSHEDNATEKKKVKSAKSALVRDILFLLVCALLLCLFFRAERLACLFKGVEKISRKTSGFCPTQYKEGEGAIWMKSWKK
jgi:proteasome lid subunit RPN8/RPN11